MAAVASAPLILKVIQGQQTPERFFVSRTICHIH